MSQKTIQLSFFIALTVCLLVLSFLVFKPYLGVMFVASVLSVAFYPVYQKLLLWFNGREGVSSVLTIFIIVVAIFVPVSLISTSLFSEAVDLYNSLVFDGNGHKIILATDAISEKIGVNILNDPSFRINVEDYIRSILNWIISHFNSVFEVVFKGFLGFILMLVAIYYMLRNALRIKESIIIWSPLPNEYDAQVIEALRSSIDAVIRGRFLVSVAQGFFLGFGFFIFGIGNPVLWGFVGAFASLIPFLGTAVVTVPTSAYLLLSGSVGPGIGILLWGALAVGLIDDLLSVIILKKTIKINPLVILMSILGGVQFFGPVGLLAGPVLISAFLSLVKIYPFIMFRDRKYPLESND